MCIVEVAIGLISIPIFFPHTDTDVQNFRKPDTYPDILIHVNILVPIPDVVYRYIFSTDSQHFSTNTQYFSTHSDSDDTDIYSPAL